MFGLMMTLVVSSSAPDVDTERIRSHLQLVEALLRAQHAPDAAAEAERLRNLEVLHAYWLGGVFPQNITVPGGRSPIFIDHRGVACAAAALIIASGHRALAERISATMNEQYLDQMHDAELGTWVDASGLSLGELRLIQPGYPYQPAFQEPLLEAAYLGDLPKVRQLLDVSKNLKADASDVVRAAALSAQTGRLRVRDNPEAFITLLKRGVPIAHVPSLDAAYELLLVARKKGKADDVRVLEGAIAGTPRLPPNGCEPTLQRAVKNADTGRIDVLVAHGVTLRTCPERQLWKMLIEYERALTPAQLKTVELSVRAGLNVNDEGAPLRWAIDHNDTALAAMLFERGAQPSANTGFNCTLLSLAVAHDNVAIAKMMMAHHVPRATEFDASPRCPGELHPERPRPVDKPVPGQAALYFSTGAGFIRVVGDGPPQPLPPPKITVVDMKLSPKMKAVLEL